MGRLLIIIACAPSFLLRRSLCCLYECRLRLLVARQLNRLVWFSSPHRIFSVCLSWPLVFALAVCGIRCLQVRACPSFARKVIEGPPDDTEAARALTATATDDTPDGPPSVHGAVRQTLFVETIVSCGWRWGLDAPMWIHTYWADSDRAYWRIHPV